MKSYLLLICIVALLSMSACVKTSKTRLLARQAVEPGSTNQTNFQELVKHIPKLYWVDERGQPGQKFVAFMTRNNTFLYCDPQSNLPSFNRTTNLTQDYMFLPEMGSQNKTFSLKTRHGKYFGLENDKFTCNLSKPDNNSFITFERNPRVSGAAASGNVTDTLALKFSKGYLGFRDHMATIVPTLNESAIFLPPTHMNRTSGGNTSDMTSS
jgi:hypothetical protein